MQFDVLASVLLDGGEEEGEVLFDITKSVAAGVARSGPETQEVDDTPVHATPIFNEVIADHHSQMICNARHLTGDFTRADDIVQDSIVRAMRSWERFLKKFEALRAERLADNGDDAYLDDADSYADDLDDAVSAWLHRIVTNAFITAYHHGKRATRRTVQWATEQRIERGGGAVDPRGDLDSPVGDEVARAMATLNGDHRKVVEMHYLRGMDCAEIAVELGCSKNTVFTRLARAREALGPLLSGYARSTYGIGLVRGADDDDLKDEGAA